MTADLLKDRSEFIENELHQLCKLVFKCCWSFHCLRKAAQSRWTTSEESAWCPSQQKTYNHILLNCIQNPIDNLLRNNQAGFRSGRSYTQQIHLLPRVLEEARAQLLPLYIKFLDFKKAFDSILRPMMFTILKHYGIPRKIIGTIRV